MKYGLIFVLSLFFLVSCGNNNDDDRFLNGVNGVNGFNGGFGQQCGINQINGFNNFNNFNNGFGGGPFQMGLARRCGMVLNNGFNGGFNNGFNGGLGGGCFVPGDLQHLADYDYIDAEMIANINEQLETELREVYGIVEPQTEEDVQAYFTQVGFSAGVNTGGGWGGGWGQPFAGPGFAGNPWGFCDQLAL